MIISQKTILDLVILNLIQAILTVIIIVLLSSCAPNHRAPLWLRAIETLPPVEGFSRAGLFGAQEDSKTMIITVNIAWIKLRITKSKIVF
jgi:hypothetical protein